MTRVANTTAAAIAVIAAAVFIPAPARAAGSVVLWACHGPGGEALGAAPFASVTARDGVAGTYGSGCKEPEGPAGADGLLATFSRADPEGGSSASWEVRVPAGVTLDSVGIARTTSGFGGSPVAGDPQSYEARTSSMSLESSSLQAGSEPLSGELSLAPVTGGYVRLGVGCGLLAGERCESPLEGTVGVDVSSIALGVQDSSPPTGAVGGVRSPVAGTLGLSLYASDTGLGLANAEASLEGGASTFVRLGAGACPEHPSPTATINLPLGADCPQTVSGIPLSLDTAGVPDGEHTLRVSVTDAAGNTSTLVDRPIVVENTPAPADSSTVTIGIGSSGSSGGSATGSPAGAGGVLGSFSSSTPGGKPVACQLPDLSMRLTSKPLRYAKSGKRRIPVLRSRHHYVFKGHLTCLLHNHRISAPTGIVLRALYTIKTGHHRYRTYASGRGTMTVHNGNLRAVLGYYSSRTIIFRYKPGNGEFAQVKVPIEVAPKRSRASRQR